MKPEAVMARAIDPYAFKENAVWVKPEFCGERQMKASAKAKDTIAALRATGFEIVQGWQSIERAPPSSDTRPLWLWIPAWRMHCQGWFDEDGWWQPTRSNGRMGIPPPSHWQHLPAPPAEDSGE